MMEGVSGRVHSEPGSRASTEPLRRQGLGPLGFDPSRVEQTAKLIGAGGKRAIQKMTPTWQLPGKATFDANGAHNAWWRARGAVERIILKDGNRGRMGYRLTPFGEAIQAALRDSAP